MGEIQGGRVYKQEHSRWANEFEKHAAPRPLDYYWLIGDFNTLDREDETTDQWALDNGYISIVPIHTDMTHIETMQQLQRDIKAFINNP